MISRYLLVALGLAALVACGGSASVEEETVITSEVTVVCEDSLVLKAWFTPGLEVRAPLFVTLPMLGKTYESFLPFMEAVTEYASNDTSGRNLPTPNFLNLDLRGHGQSTRRGSDTVTYAGMDEEQFGRMPADVARMIAKVLTEHGARIDSSYIVVVGASIGANSAMLLTELMPSIRKVVLLSPGENYRGLKPAQAFEAFTGQVLIVTSQQDSYSARSSQKLAELKMENWLLKLYAGNSHGTDIINSLDRAMAMLVEWCFEEEEPAGK
jgi:hypothetical protein